MRPFVFLLGGLAASADATSCSAAAQKLGCVPNVIEMADSYGPFDMIPDFLVPWRNTLMGHLMDMARQKQSCHVLGTFLGTRCPPVGLISWVEHNMTEHKLREDVTIEWPFVPLWIDLGGGLLLFRLIIFPLMMGAMGSFFKRQDFWERIQGRTSAYGVPESEEAVWGGVIGVWHALTSAGLVYAWSTASVYWFRRFVLLEVIWELDDFLMIILRTPTWWLGGFVYGGSSNMYAKASPRIIKIMTIHHILGLVYIPFGYLKHAHNSNTHMLALSLILHGAVGRMVATIQHLVDSEKSPGVLALLHGTNLAMLTFCRFYLFPFACWGAGRDYHTSDSEIGPTVEIVLDLCHLTMFFFNLFIFKTSLMRTMKWVKAYQSQQKGAAKATQKKE